MSEQAYIPKRAGAGVAFLGVELKDAVIVICSVFIGIFAGSVLQAGNFGYIGIPLLGYFCNRLFIEWQSRYPRGIVKRALFRVGLSGYSKTLSSQKVVFVGDNNPTQIATYSKFIKELSDGSRESQ